MCDARAKLLLRLLNIYFFYVLVTVSSLDVPNVSCETRASNDIWRFDIGVTWTRMLDGFFHFVA